MTGDLHSVAGWIAPGITAGPTRRPVDGHNLNNHALSARALKLAVKPLTPYAVCSSRSNAVALAATARISVRSSLARRSFSIQLV